MYQVLFLLLCVSIPLQGVNWKSLTQENGKTLSIDVDSVRTRPNGDIAYVFRLQDEDGISFFDSMSDCTAERVKVYRVGIQYDEGDSIDWTDYSSNWMPLNDNPLSQPPHRYLCHPAS